MKELVHSIGSSELTEWIAFDSIDPIGEDRADLRAGIIAAEVFNGMHSVKEGERARPIDFMLFHDRNRPPEQPKFLSPDEEAEAVMKIFERAGRVKD